MAAIIGSSTGSNQPARRDNLSKVAVAAGEPIEQPANLPDENARCVGSA